MQELIEKYKDSFPFALIACYTLGYANLKVYYTILGIDIEYYISLSDILFFTINFLLLFSVAITFLSLITWLLRIILKKPLFNFSIRKKKKEHSQEVITRYYNKISFEYEFFLSLSILFIIVGGFFVSTGELFYSLTVLYLTSYFIIYTYYNKSLPKKNKIRNEQIKKLIFSSFIVLLITSVLHGYFNANYLKEGISNFKNSKQIEFTANSIKFSTKENKSFKFIGETSEYFFLYDIKKNKSFIFKKDNISNLSIYNSTNTIIDIAKLSFYCI